MYKQMYAHDQASYWKSGWFFNGTRRSTKISLCIWISAIPRYIHKHITRFVKSKSTCISLDICAHSLSLNSKPCWNSSQFSISFLKQIIKQIHSISNSWFFQISLLFISIYFHNFWLILHHTKCTKYFWLIFQYIFNIFTSFHY